MSERFHYIRFGTIFVAVLKRILFRTNIRRNSSAKYSAETDVSKIARIRYIRDIRFIA